MTPYGLKPYPLGMKARRKSFFIEMTFEKLVILTQDWCHMQIFLPSVAPILYGPGPAPPEPALLV